MISVNNKETAIENDINFNALLEIIKEDAYHILTLKGHFIAVINGNYIPEEQYETTIVKNFDDVKLIPSIFGG